MSRLVLGFTHGEEEIQKAIQTHNPDLLEVRIEALSRVIRIMLDRRDILPLMRYEYLCTMRGEMRNQAQAQKLIGQGQHAIKVKNIPMLRSINQQLEILRLVILFSHACASFSLNAGGTGIVDTQRSC